MKSLSKNDRDVIVLLVIVVAVCVILYPIVGDMFGDEHSVNDNDTLTVQKLGSGADEALRHNAVEGGYYDVQSQKTKLFDFDPNTADSTQLLQLGLRPWQVRNIYKYRNAGGRYREPTDFARLYGLTLEQYQRLEPYIKIKPEVMAADVYGGKDEPKSGTHGDREVQENVTQQPATSAESKSRYPVKLKYGEKINVNAADTSLLKRVPGIGSYYARQIVWKRQKLGGYAEVGQLKEIENFPESALAYMYVGGRNEISRIKINLADVKTMSRHPYILYVQAKEIYEYRQSHGAITSISEIEKLQTFTLSDAKRLEPYMDFTK